MKKLCNNLLLLCVIFLMGVWSGSSVLTAQNRINMTKWEYYDKLCREKGIENKLAKASAFADRKYGMLDVGKVRTGIQNTNRLCYAREMINFEYPKLSGIHYAWTEGVVIAGILNGEKRLSNSCLGAFSDFNEDHFEPYPGYDSGIGAEGIAINTNSNSWPSQWPGDSGPIGSLGFPGVRSSGEVAGDAELFWVAGDDVPDSKQQTPLHVKTFGRALQWSSPLADDFIVWKFYVTNIGTDTIKQCYVGFHSDIDCPEEGLGEWMDDFGVFIPADADPMLGNMLYIWDGDDKSSGYIEKGVAWTGVKMLETPVNKETGKEYGVTQLIVMTYDDFWGGLPLQSDYYNRFQGIDPPQNVTPNSMDWTETPNTYGPDVAVTMASGPVDLAPGDTVTFTFANIFGANKAELLANATLCQLLYNKDYKTAIPPVAPTVTAVPGDQQVTLYWNAEPSESSVDPLTNNNCFEGYKIYRSTDQGLTWGELITNAYGVTAGYVPLAQFDLKNAISGPSKTNDLFNLGSDSGLKHKFVDKNLENGVEYRYAVCAYDHDDAVGDLVIEPLENPRNIDNPNVLTVRPQLKPAGMQDAVVGDVEHVSGISAGTVEAEVLNPDKVVSGTYDVTFEQDPDHGTMVKVSLNGKTVLGPVPVTAPDDPNVGNLPVFNGMRLTAVNAETGIDESATGATVGDSLWLGWWTFENVNGSGLSDDYEFRFTENGSNAWQYSSPWGPVHVPFEVWNITTGMQINCDVEDHGDLSWDIENKDYVAQHNTPYDPDNYISTWPDDYNYYWRFSTDSKYHVGDIFRMVTYKPFSTNDKYQFTATGASVVASKKALDKITVVPNPYPITSQYETLEWVKELQFHGLPEKCTIRIYTISGDLVAILHHEPGDPGYRGPSVQAWKLWNYNDQEVAFGVYIFHVKAEGFGEKLGKFAIIK